MIAEPVPDEPARALERGERRRPLGLVPQHGDENLRQPQVVGGLDLGDGDEAQTRILQLALQDHRDLLLDELVDAAEPLALHQRSSTDSWMTMPSTFASMKSRALETTSFACRESSETYATARVTRCHLS